MSTTTMMMKKCCFLVYLSLYLKFTGSYIPVTVT